MSDSIVVGISGDGSTIKKDDEDSVEALRHDFNALLAQLRARKIL